MLWMSVCVCVWQQGFEFIKFIVRWLPQYHIYSELKKKKKGVGGGVGGGLYQS